MSEPYLNQVFAAHARFNPDGCAIHFDGEDLCWSAFANGIDRNAARLRSLGVDRGDRVALLAANHPGFFVLLAAVARLGAILVPLNWRLATEELTWILNDCRPKLLFHDRGHAEIGLQLADTIVNPAITTGEALRSIEATLQSSAAPEPIRTVGVHEDDTLLLVYTSGTTGRPKGAMLSHKALLCSARMSCHAYAICTEDRVLNVLPLFHVGGINIQPLPALLSGATLVLHPRFDAADTVRALDTHQITLVNTVPTILQAMLADPGWDSAALASLKSVSIGSTDVPMSLIRRVHQRGIPLVQIYGATETSPAAIYQQPGFAMQTEGSIGRVGMLCDVRLSDEHGHEVPVGQPGEICVRGDNLLSGYWQNPAASDAAVVDGWFRSGDIARRDEHGNFWFVDRVKFVIISGGENIYPAEVERVIRQDTRVREVAVVGRDDERWGEVPVAVVVGDGVDVDRLSAICERKLASFKRPKDWVLVDALPKNAMGKVVIDEVRQIASRAAH